MDEFFSDALLRAARPHLAWVAEQMDLFRELVPIGDVETDLAARKAWQSGHELEIGILGSFAEDGTWLWGWANSTFDGMPVIAESARLRSIGEQYSVPELTEGLVDLNHLPDPRLGSDHMAFAAMGLLGARGVIIFNYSGRARAFLVTFDPMIPEARTDLGKVASFLHTGATMLPGPEAQEGRGYASTVVRGYGEHHQLPVTETAQGMELRLATGNRIAVHIDGNDQIESVDVTGPDGGFPVAEATQTLSHNPAVAAEPTLPGLPEGLLVGILPRLAGAVAQDIALQHHLADNDWNVTSPVWDASSGTLRYSDDVELAAREVGSYDSAAEVWRWPAADEQWQGVAHLRAWAHESGHPEVAGDEVALSGRQKPGHIAEILALTAVDLGEGRGLCRLDFPDGERYYLAVTDPRVPVCHSGPDTVSRDVLSTANLVHPVTGETERYEVMYQLAVGYFQRFGIATVHEYEPHVLGGRFGSYEAWVRFSEDGSIGTVDVGVAQSQEGSA
ncbi:DUF6882 domain-containing protein [Salinactinospora qingdaonensis]|uniref:Uncharacterized protein n=1 Tax=Salinactinospora qingdaonensis TaxID=702744 RepID=A0ABP7FYK1_9ACTN